MSFKKKVFAFCCLLSDTEAPFRLEIRGIYANNYRTVPEDSRKASKRINLDVSLMFILKVNYFSDVLSYRILVNLSSRLRDNLTAFM